MRRTRLTVGGLAVMATLALAGCGGDTSSDTDDADVEVLAACVEAGECTSLEPADFAALAETDGVVLLDVRTPQEFAEGHLPGAVNVDVSAADFADRVLELDPEATYAVYCRSGNRSQTAMGMMRDAGVEHAADLAGGIGAWQADGRAVTTD